MSVDGMLESRNCVLEGLKILDDSKKERASPVAEIEMQKALIEALLLYIVEVEKAVRGLQFTKKDKYNE